MTLWAFLFLSNYLFERAQQSECGKYVEIFIFMKFHKCELLANGLISSHLVFNVISVALLLEINDHCLTICFANIIRTMTMRKLVLWSRGERKLFKHHWVVAMDVDECGSKIIITKLYFLPSNYFLFALHHRAVLVYIFLFFSYHRWFFWAALKRESPRGTRIEDGKDVE